MKLRLQMPDPIKRSVFAELRKSIVGIAMALVSGACHLKAAEISNVPLLPEAIVEGVVTFRGEIPKSSVPDDAGVRRDLLQVDPETRGLANVVVWLALDRPAPAPAEKDSTRATPAVPAVMDQRNHEFVPRVLAVHSGQLVKFTNNDPANHNVRTFSSQHTNEFNVFTGIDGSYTHRFTADAQQRPVRLGCDIHPWMRGWIYVLDHSLFAVTDERGRFRISSVPAGKHTLVIRQPDVRYHRERMIPVSNAAPAKVEIEIRAEELTKPAE